MKRTIGVLLCVLALTVGLMAASSAETVTKTGTGELKKIVATNGANAVTVKVYGPGGACKIRQLQVNLTGRDGKKYDISGTCHETWVKYIYYGQTRVRCADFVMRYNSDLKFWRVYVPRSCLKNLTNRIKVQALIFGPAAPSTAGPTRWLTRG